MKKLLYTYLVILMTCNLFGQATVLTPSNAEPADEYGYSVAYGAGYAIVGTQNKSAGGVQRGAVYIYRKDHDEWEEQAILTAPDGMDYDRFGHAVAIDGDYIIVGAHSHDANGLNSGAAYIFRREGEEWQLGAKITPDDAAQGQTFGIAVDIHGDYAIIGANHSFVNGNINVGAAYIFHRTNDTWTQEAKLTPEDGYQNDFFGQSVAIYGDKVVVSSHFNNSCGDNTGAAYFFTRNGDTWTESIKVAACDAEDYDSFGSSVDIYENQAIIGSFGDDDNGSASGSAYIFTYKDEMWMQTAKLTASDGAADDKFGYSVSIDKDIAVVGASERENGAIYVFQKEDNTWGENQVITSPELSDDAELGMSVSLYDNMVLTGAPLADNIADDSGAALVFVLDVDIEVVDTKEVDSQVGKAVIYPNPAANTLNIKTKNDARIQAMTVYNMQGKPVFYAQSGQPRYDISFLPAGIYTLQLKTQTGMWREKFVVKR